MYTDYPSLVSCCYLLSFGTIACTTGKVAPVMQSLPAFPVFRNVSLPLLYSLDNLHSLSSGTCV